MHIYVYTCTYTFTLAHIRLHLHIYVYTNITEGHVLATLTEPGKEGVSTLWKGTESPNIPFTPAHMCGACERGRRPRSGLSCVRRLHWHICVYTCTYTFTPAHIRLHLHIYVYTRRQNELAIGPSTLWKGTESPNIPFTLAHIRLHLHIYVYTCTYTFTLAHICLHQKAKRVSHRP